MPSWVFILHFYQPPTQSLSLTETILRSCYLPILDVLLAHPEAQFTINLNGSLVLQLEMIREHDFFNKVKILLERGQIEILNSPIFHPIIPLTPADVVLRQLKENASLIERFCGTKPVAGIYPPELALDEPSLKLLRGQAEFVIADESSVNADFDLKKIPTGLPVYQTTGLPTNLLTSSRALTEIIRTYPNELQAEKLIKFINSHINAGDAEPNSLNASESDSNLKGSGIAYERFKVAKRQDPQPLLVSVSDAEVFGHHYSERIHFLRDLLERKEFKFIKASEATKLTTYNSQLTAITASSWQTTAADIKGGNPYPLWKNPGNNLQQKYYQLADLAYQALFATATETETIPTHLAHAAENHFDQGISSCHPYWLSNTPWWHPDLVEAGARQLIKCIRTLPVSPEQKRRAEEFFHKFMTEVWTYHWSGKVEEKYREYDRARAELLKKLPEI